MDDKRPRGRPKKHAHFEELVKGLKAGAKKRPTYLNGVGVLKGARDTTAFVKVTLRRANSYRGRHIPAGSSVEIKLGALTSWSWEELEAERVRYQGLADRGEPLEPAAAMLFADHAEAWLDLKKAQRGYGTAKGNVRVHLSPTFGKKALAEIVVGDIDKWVAAQRETHKPASVQRQLGTLKAVLNYAVKTRRLEKNPAANVEPIHGIEGRRRYLSEAERKTLFEAAAVMEAEQEARTTYKDHEIKGWLSDFLMWALHSGMRRGEILDLRFPDIARAKNDRSYVHVDKTKGGQARYIDCSEEMLKIVERLRGLKRSKGDDRLFPVSMTTAKRKLTRLWKSAGLGDVRLHDLRRTHVTELVSSGIGLREVAERVGHRDLSMLEKHYAVFKGDSASANKAQELFGGRVV